MFPVTLNDVVPPESIWQGVVAMISMVGGELALHPEKKPTHTAITNDPYESRFNMWLSLCPMFPDIACSTHKLTISKILIYLWDLVSFFPLFCLRKIPLRRMRYSSFGKNRSLF
jgi:hypothetical protein